MVVESNLKADQNKEGKQHPQRQKKRILMKLLLDVPEKFVPDGICPIKYEMVTPIRHYEFCSITGVWCYGNLENRPAICPIVEVDERTCREWLRNTQ